MADKMLLAMYAEYFANWLTNGRLIAKDKISAIGIKSIYNRFITKKYITKVWCVCALPVTYNNNITDGIRNIMFQNFPNVKTTILTYNVPINVNYDNRLFRNQYEKAMADYEKYGQYFASLRSDEQAMGKEVSLGRGKYYRFNKSDLMKYKDVKDSYEYVYKSCVEQKQFMYTYYFIQASAKNQKDIDKYSKKLEGLLTADKILYQELKGCISEYLTNYGPATFLHSHESKKISPMLFSEDNLASQMSYRTKGLVGGSGIMVGLDWQTKLPFLWNPFESTSAQVIAVDAKSGEGKTYMCFAICQQIIGCGIHCSEIDIKGNEWIKMAPFVKTKVLSMDDAHPRFVNTLRLDDLNATKENAYDLYMNAVRGTISLLSLMVDLQPNEGSRGDLEMLLEKAVTKLFTKHEVYPSNPATFIRTKNLKYPEVLDIVDELKNTQSYTKTITSLCDLIRTRCSPFFLSGSRYSAMFENEITVGEILETPNVVYSFNKNANGELDNLDSIKVFMVQFLDSKKHEMRKQQGLHTVAFYEELQRCKNNGILLNYISSRVTGSRSSNVSIFLLFNAISALDADGFSQIRSNITTKIIGKVTEKDIDKLVNDYECGPIEKYLRLINNPESTGYKNCFAIQYDTGKSADKAIIRAELPDYMWEQFNTREVVDL
jgi:hypothetical protein